MAELKKLISMDSEVMSDETFENMLEALQKNSDSSDVNELLKVMNENRIISHEEAEKIMELEGSGGVVKCGLPQSVRPSDPENKTDVETCIGLLQQDDPSLNEINLNNMKRTPIPQIQKLIAALHKNTNLKKLSLANTGLTDNAAEPLLEMLEKNRGLESLNLETNFLSGEFLAKLFKAALTNQTLREVKCVNQSIVFSTEAEMEMMNYIYKNEALTKVSANLRHPEARNKIEKATLRNGEIKRQKRQIEAIEKVQKEQKAAEEEAAKKAAAEKAAADEAEKRKAKLAEPAKPAAAASAAAKKPQSTTAAAAAAVKAKARQSAEAAAEDPAKPKETMKVYKTPNKPADRPKTPTYGYGGMKK